MRTFLLFCFSLYVPLTLGVIAMALWDAPEYPVDFRLASKLLWAIAAICFFIGQYALVYLPPKKST